MDWTRDRIEQLTTADVRQLRANAETLGGLAVLALCDEVLSRRPKRPVARRVGRPRSAGDAHLVSRRKALEAQGVILRNPGWSWGGVRNSDGAVILTVWAEDVQTSNGTCSCLLWAPNVNASRPWSDKPGGKERLEHCRLALAQGTAEGLLVYGERLPGRLPEDKASTVRGADPDTVLRFRVIRRGEEFWAVWGKNSPPLLADPA
jgi:hypothetical protein